MVSLSRAIRKTVAMSTWVRLPVEEDGQSNKYLETHWFSYCNANFVEIGGVVVA